MRSNLLSPRDQKITHMPLIIWMDYTHNKIKYNEFTRGVSTKWLHWIIHAENIARIKKDLNQENFIRVLHIAHLLRLKYDRETWPSAGAKMLYADY